MKRKVFLGSTILLVAVVSLLVVVRGWVWAQGPAPQSIPSDPSTRAVTAFTYQGRLTDGGIPTNGTYDFRFELYDDLTAGTRVGGPLGFEDVTLTRGLFSVELDFGHFVVTGYPRYLEIGVRPGDSEGDFEILSPRQKLPAAPHALALPGLYTQPQANTNNVIAGGPANNVAPKLGGATISGGGGPDTPNQVLAHYGTVSGGERNIAGGQHATVSGGFDNTAGWDGDTVGGGKFNTAASAVPAPAPGEVTPATVAGGQSNFARGSSTTVGGGLRNTANGDFATVAGGRDNTVNSDSATIAGGRANTASADYAIVGGGRGNTASEVQATVGGGFSNTASGPAATIAGGDGNTASGSESTVGGGRTNTASEIGSTVGGGQVNTASGPNSTVSGGVINTASNTYATVSGGNQNTASGLASTVGGGERNTAMGAYSFAAGRRGKANHDGAFVWADSTDGDFASTAANQFNVRATGGTRIVSAVDANGDPTAGVQLAPGASAWSTLSDRDAKVNLALVDGHEALARLAAMPIQTWNYKSQDLSIRHIGPTAQDFYAAFGLGEDDRHISTVDADGVALAAIQGLYQLLQEKDAQIAALQAENAAQQEEITALEARLAAVEQAIGRGRGGDKETRGWSR
ncbi:MAG: tail fiber domain-containing protein [Anaerolineae bacterium]